MQRKKLSAASSCTAVAALLMATISVEAHAETLIYVTQDTIGTVDSSQLGLDNTPGGNGPLTYELPDGYFTVGAKVSIDFGALYLLATNGSTCQLFSANTAEASGQATLTMVNSSYSCSYPSGTGDVAFIPGTGSSSTTDEYLAAQGSSTTEVAAGGSVPTSIALTNANGGAADLVGITASGASPNEILYGIDAGTSQLVSLNLTTGTESNLIALGVTPADKTSLDFSSVSANLYLYTSGLLYSTSSPQIPFSLLGQPPSGSIAVVAADTASVLNSGSGGGAFDPTILLSLLGLAGVRRRSGRVAAARAVVGHP